MDTTSARKRNFKAKSNFHPWAIDELRAEREALSLIHFLRDQSQPQSAWLADIAADHTISEPVRQRALQFARDWK